MAVVLKDYAGREIRLTDERKQHILEHPEMQGLEAAIGDTLARPEAVIRSLSDRTVWLYYHFYPDTRVGDKWLSVVVKADAADAFVITAYLTDKVKGDDIIWSAKP